MRYTSKAAWAIAAVATVALTASAADARSRYVTRYQGSPSGYGDAYNAYGGAYNGYGGAYGARSERFIGTSVPYDADGPGWNDFQLQGRN